jgi:hypothetical protein
VIRPLLAAAVALLMSAPAIAGPPIAGDVDVFVELGFTPSATDYFAAGSYTQGGNTATVALTPSVSISLVGQGGAAYPGNDSSRALARVTYDYVILLSQVANAPDRVDGLVDVLGNYALTIQSASPAGFASISAATATDRNLFFSQPDGGFFTRSIYANSDGGSYSIKGPGLLIDSAYSYNGATWLAYRGSLRLSAGLTPTAPSSAMIDPVISVNQTALQNAGLQGQAVLLLSPGVGNALTGGVPEPAQWALLIGGFALAGAAARRRRIVFA